MSIFELIRNNRIKDLNTELRIRRIEESSQGLINLEFFNKDGLTPLMYAASEGNLDAVVELLKFGANPETRSKPQNDRQKAKQAHELSEDDDIVELLKHFMEIVAWNRKQSKNEINWDEVHWVLSKYPELIQASIDLNHGTSIANVIASRPEKSQGDAGYQKVLQLLAQEKLKGHVKAQLSVRSAITNQNLPLIKIIVKSGEKVDGATIMSGLTSTNRDIHLYFKKHFDADKTNGIENKRWNRSSMSDLNSALYKTLAAEAKGENKENNVTTSQDLLSVGANPLSLEKSHYNRDDKSAKKLFFKLGLISKKRWEALAKDTAVYFKKNSNGILFSYLRNIAPEIAAFITLTLIVSTPAFAAFMTAAPAMPAMPLLEPVTFFLLALIPSMSVAVLTSYAQSAVISFLRNKGKKDNAESAIPQSVSTIAWKLVDELAPHYANEFINSVDLAKQAHAKMKKDAEKGKRSYSSTEVHDLLIERVQKVTSKVSAEDKASLLAKYGATYKESFELAKKKKDATPADLPNKDRGLKDETVTWAFQLAQAHVAKGHKKPKMESKHLQKLKVF